ncbi:hypothetical protein Bca52824_064904 [Brassica carinata]|uniref:Uncharacterized protein n=1 Tax=Brassica carinata TaxID=52824 RepID=A0A8X7QH86_BRACI|nr:hypothetical protein Bca52824_064904 [Brassica carinata]
METLASDKKRDLKRLHENLSTKTEKLKLAMNRRERLQSTSQTIKNNFQLFTQQIAYMWVCYTKFYNCDPLTYRLTLCPAWVMFAIQCDSHILTRTRVKGEKCQGCGGAGGSSSRQSLDPMIPNLWMRIYVLIPKLSSDSVAFIYSSSASVSLSLSSPAHRPSPIRKLYPEADLIVAELLHEIVTGGGAIVSSLMLELQNLSKGQKKSGSAGIVVFNYKDCNNTGVTDGEKSKTGKKGAKAPWAKPLSRYSQTTRCDLMNNIWVCCRHTLMRPGFTYTTEDYLKITEEQLKASSPGKSQTDDQIQTQEPAVQSQPEVTSRETMAASPPRQD